MITEHVETSTNIPHRKWYIIFVKDNKEIIFDLEKQLSDDVAMTISKGCKLVTFDSEEEGKTYILDNALITHETINNNIFND
jgi:hypothetical protein